MVRTHELVFPQFKSKLCPQKDVPGSKKKIAYYIPRNIMRSSAVH